MNVTSSTNTRDEYVRNHISESEACEMILKLGGNPNLQSTSFDIWDQLLACESVSESTPCDADEGKRDVNDYWNGNVVRKQHVNTKWSQGKQEVISKLDKCNYRTPPLLLESLLMDLFDCKDTKAGHWLYVAQNWNPRAINRTIQQMIKKESTGSITIQKPAAYFTRLIKFRKKRRNTY